MKKSLLLAAILFLCSIVYAQNQLLVQQGDKGLYLKHTVTAGQTFFGLGRAYNITPQEIASYNALDMNNGLNVGQTVLIPLNSSNFSQSTEGGTPVYYVVGEKEGLYRVSLKNNTVLMESLRKWNKLSSDNIQVGQKLIVGFLQGNGTANNTVAVETKTEPPVKIEPKPKTEEPKQTTTPVSEPVKPVSNNTVRTTTNTGNGGYFKSHFDQQSRTSGNVKDITASAGIFKTASGWQDAKYYALIDNVEPGTIVKVVNPTNNKAIYTKVLGAMSGIRQNEGYDVRISNAAANMLDVGDSEKFIVKVNY